MHLSNKLFKAAFNSFQPKVFVNNKTKNKLLHKHFFYTTNTQNQKPTTSNTRKPNPSYSNSTTGPSRRDEVQSKDTTPGYYHPTETHNNIFRNTAQAAYTTA